MGIVVIGTTFVDVKGHPFGKYVPTGRNAGRVIIYRIITEKKKISNSRTLFTLTSWNFLPSSAIIKLRKAFLCVVCEQGRKKLCAGGNRSLNF